MVKFSGCLLGEQLRLLSNIPFDSSQLPDSIKLSDSIKLEADPFRLDPAVFPRRLDLKLSIEAHALLLKLAAQCGRSPGELAEHLISRCLHEEDDLGNDGDQIAPSPRS